MVKKVFFLLNIDFTIAILDLVVRVHLASSVVCHATQIIEIFHIMQLFLVCHNLWWGWLPWDSHYLSFFPHPFTLHRYTVCPTRYRTRHFFNPGSILSGRKWWSLPAHVMIWCFSDRASWIAYILITNLMQWLLFIHKILYSPISCKP